MSGPAGDSRKARFGLALRGHRQAAGLKQAQLAEQMVAAGHPWHGSTVSKCEAGDRDPSLTELGDLASILNTAVVDLLGDVDHFSTLDHRSLIALAEHLLTAAKGTAQILDQVAAAETAAIDALQTGIQRMTAGLGPAPTVPEAPIRLATPPAARVPAAAQPHTDHHVGGRGWSR
jgi:transcriptional regulator with XRE-family HTH domain